MQTFFAESMSMLFKKQPKISRQYTLLTKSEAFKAAHKIARQGCSSIKYQTRFSAAYKQVMKENCVLTKKKPTSSYYVCSVSDKSFYVLVSAYNEIQAISICEQCEFFEPSDALEASTYI